MEICLPSLPPAAMNIDRRQEVDEEMRFNIWTGLRGANVQWHRSMRRHSPDDVDLLEAETIGFSSFALFIREQSTFVDVRWPQCQKP